MELPAIRCKEQYAQIVPIEDFFAFDKKGTESNYKIDYELPEHVSNVKCGDTIGKAIV